MAGPCSWNITTPPTCCDCWDSLSPTQQAAATEYATVVLWAATGRQYGECSYTVRPCGQWCADNGLWGYTWSDGIWVPYIANGVWRNCWCGCAFGVGCCTCEPTCQVYLPGPVTAVTQVVQDGAVVDPSAYRVDGNRWLVRTDGNCWPYCQDFDSDAGAGGAANTMQVTYTRGIAVPAALLNAAGILACEFGKACSGGSCRLPQRLSTVARQGVQLTFQDVDSLIAAGLTGLPDVDQIILAYNPYGLKSRLRVWSPDLPVTKQVTIP